MKMRNLMILAMLVSTMVLVSCGQKENVPAKVKTAFEQKFPDAKKVSWDKENATEWEAEFKMNGKEYSANFSSDGKWLETEYETKESDIPSLVKSTLDKEFDDYDIEEVEISETVNGKLYEIALEKDDTDIGISITADGIIVKKETKKEDNDDEETDND